MAKIGVVVELYRCAAYMTALPQNLVRMLALWSIAFVLLINVLFLRSATLFDWVLYAEEVVDSIPIRKNVLRKARNSAPLSQWKRFTRWRQFRSNHSTKLKPGSPISEQCRMRCTLTNCWGAAVSVRKCRILEKVGVRSGPHMSARIVRFSELSSSFPFAGFLVFWLWHTSDMMATLSYWKISSAKCLI